MKNWKTTVFGVLGAVLAVLGFFKPELFTAENNNVIMANLDSIITAVLALIAVFAAKDELSKDNV
jgi:hypothetical protein